MTFYEHSANSISGDPISMDSFQNKVVLVVNTASNCGFTPQYEGLEALYQEYKDQGLEILGFPCNQFGNQEAGSNEEINGFCQINYGVSFPLFEKVKVNGPEAHPIFQYLKSKKGGIFGDSIKWNFTKFLIDKEGNVIKRFPSTKKPKAIEKEIKALL